MAIQSNLKLKGTFDSLIFYQWKGIDCIRTRPATVKRVPVAIENSRVFGLAANRSKILRCLLQPVLPEPGNRKMIHRLHKAFSDWLKTNPLQISAEVNNLALFNGLSLNEALQDAPRFKLAVPVSRMADNILQVHLPSFNPLLAIKAPENTIKVVLQFKAVSLAMDDPSIVETVSSVVNVNYAPGILPAQSINLPLLTATGKLCIIIMSVQYFLNSNKAQAVDLLPWMPCTIVGSFYN